MKTKSVRLNTLYALLGHAAIAAGGFMVNVILVRSVDKDLFGTYSYFIALAGIFIPFLDLGIVGFNSMRGARNRASVGQYLVRSLILKGLFVITVVPVFVGVFYFIENTLGLIFLLTLGYLLFQSLMTQADMVFIPLEQNNLWSYRRIAYEVTLIILFCLLIFVLEHKTVGGFLGATVVATAVAALLSATAIARLLPLNRATLREALTKFSVVGEIKEMFPFTLFQLFYFMFNRLNIVYLAKLADEANVADYRVSFLVMELCLYLPKGLTQAAGPRLSLYYHSGNREDFDRLFRHSVELIAFGAVVFMIGGFLYGPEIITFVFGERYANVGPLWQVMNVVMGVMFVQNLMARVLNFLGYAKPYSIQVGATMLVQAVANVYLASHYGAIGVAWGMLTAVAILFALNYRTIIRAFHRHPLPLKKLPGLAVLAAVVGLSFHYGVERHFLLEAPAMVACFLLLAFALGLMPSVLRAAATSAVARVRRR